jgi:hypothetical protein
MHHARMQLVEANLNLLLLIDRLRDAARALELRSAGAGARTCSALALSLR